MDDKLIAGSHSDSIGRKWEGRNRNAPIIRLFREALSRLDEHTSMRQCPFCSMGTLAGLRDSKTLALKAGDMCLLCGQRVEYLDVGEAT